MLHVIAVTLRRACKACSVGYVCGVLYICALSSLFHGQHLLKRNVQCTKKISIFSTHKVLLPLICTLYVISFVCAVLSLPETATNVPIGQSMACPHSNKHMYHIYTYASGGVSFQSGDLPLRVGLSNQVFSVSSLSILTYPHRYFLHGNTSQI